ncbi:MAG TPA: hypothetical protein VF590_06430 [Isosphaeraceae bacterium]|jgi:hypothetical protein
MRTRFSAAVIMVTLGAVDSGNTGLAQTGPSSAAVEGTAHGRDREVQVLSRDAILQDSARIEFAEDRIASYLDMRLRTTGRYYPLYKNPINPDMRHMVLCRAVYSNLRYLSHSDAMLDRVLTDVRDTRGHKWIDPARIKAELPDMKVERLKKLQDVETRLEAAMKNGPRPALIKVDIPEHYRIQAKGDPVAAEEVFTERDKPWIDYEIYCLKNPGRQDRIESRYLSSLVERLRRCYESPGEPELRIPERAQHWSEAIQDYDYRRLKQAVFYTLTDFLGDETTLRMALDEVAQQYREIGAKRPQDGRSPRDRVLEELAGLRGEKRRWLEKDATDCVKAAEVEARRRLEEMIRTGPAAPSAPRSVISVIVPLPPGVCILSKDQSKDVAVEVFRGMYEVKAELEVLR